MISLGLAEQDKEATLNLGLGQTETTVGLKPEVMERRVQKTHFGMGDASPGVETIRQDFWGGQEAKLREHAALQEQLRQQNAATKMVEEAFARATAEGRQLNPEEAEQVKALSAEVPVAPETVFETNYAKKFTEALVTTNLSDTTFGESLLSKPQETHQILDASQFIVTRQEIAHNVADEINQKYEETSWLRWGWDFAEGVIPFYTWSNVTDRIKDVKAPSWLTGSNIQEQIEGLWLLPPLEFQDRLKAAAAEIAENNIIDAKMFVEAVLSYSTSDRIWDNVFFGMDAADVATLGITAGGGALIKGAAKAGSAGTRTLSGRIRAAVSANANPNMTVSDAVAATGNIRDAAKIGVIRDLVEPQAEGQVGTVLETLRKRTPGLMDPQGWLRGPGSLSNEHARRLAESLDKTGAKLFEVVDGITVIDRIGAEAATAALEVAEKTWRHTYPYLEDAVVEIVPEIARTEVYGGVDLVNVYLGTKKATSFASEAKAKSHAKNYYGLQDGTYDVVLKDGNYLLRMQQTVDETDLRIEHKRISTDLATPIDFFNTYFGRGRTPDDLLGEGHTVQRKASTYAGNAVMARMQEAATSIGKLSGKEIDRVRDILMSNRFETREYLQPDGSKVKLPGNYYETVEELERAYLAKHKQLPSYKETEAYFKFRMLSDFDYAMRNLAMYRDKARMGVSQYSVGLLKDEGNGKKKFEGSAFFEARKVDSLPGANTEPYTIAIQNQNTGKWNLHLSTRLNRDVRETLDKVIADGKFQILQTMDELDPELQTLTGSKGTRVNYVIGIEAQSKPLNPVQIGYRPGGHIINPQVGFYLKQPNTWTDRFGFRNYGGDVSAYYFPSGKQGQKWAKKYEDFRLALKNNADDATLARLEVDLPTENLAEAKALFRTDANPDAPFSLDEPFTLVRSGQRTADVLDLPAKYGQQFVDLSKSEHNAMRNVNSRFAQERGVPLQTINEENNSVFTNVPAPTLDPVVALERSARDLMRSRVFEDYKHSSVENWGIQFGNILEYTKEQIKADPMRILTAEPRFKNGADIAQVEAARNARRSILSILGTPSDLENHVDLLMEKAVDGIYTTDGTRGLNAIKAWEWKADTDPIRMIRGLTFHAKLGVFNPKQLFLQYAGFVHTLAIDGNPIRSGQATFAAWAMRGMLMGDHNPKYIAKMAKNVRKALHIPEDHFMEMYAAHKKLGMYLVEGEVAMKDDYFTPSLVKSKFGWVMDSSTFFFKEGERANRVTAFNAAYLKWRKENPQKRLTNEVINQLGNRADIMTLNMTRASNTPLLQGGSGLGSKLMSIPLQFGTFQMRMSEQMLGKRLTPKEKARIMGVYSLMYGLPVGVLGTTLGAVTPVYELWRTAALENGSDIDDNGLLQIINEGIPQVLLEVLGGPELNVAETFGPGGNQMFGDLLDGDMKVLMGASGSFTADVIENTSPFLYSIGQLFTPKANEAWPLAVDSLLDMAREISTVNNLASAYAIYNWNKFYTQNEVAVADMEKWAGIYKFLFGLHDQKVTDAFLMGKSLKDLSEYRKSIETLGMKYFNRGLRAINQGDSKEGKANWDRARAYLIGAGYTEMEINDVWKRYLGQAGNRTILENIGPDFILKGPADKREERRKFWEKRYN